MIKTLHRLFALLVFLVPFVCFAQTGVIKGVVSGTESGETLDATAVYLTGKDSRFVREPCGCGSIPQILQDKR